jgi:diguanylate cyclase (GGDEF)-like protein/PAS domain S-box-containing protein
MTARTTPKDAPDGPKDLRRRAKARLQTRTPSLEKISPEEARNLVQELQIHQVELEMQNNQLRQTQAELENSLKRYTDLYDFAPVAYLTLDDRGWILEANLTAAQLLGTERRRLVQQPLAPFIRPEDKQKFRAYLAAVVQGQGAPPLELNLLGPGGAEVALQLDSLLVPDAAGRPQVRTSLIDVTARRQAELQRQQQHHLLDGINRIFREVLTFDTEEELGRTCLAVAEELTGSKFGFIGEINRAGRLDTLALSDPGWQACRMPKSNVLKMINDMEIRGLWARALKEGKSQIVNDPASDPNRVGLPAGHPPITSFLGVPLRHEGRIMGCISLGNKDGGYGQSDLDAVEALSVPIVEALRRRRAETELARQAQDLAQHNREIGLLNDLGELLQGCHTVAEAYPVIGRSLGRLFAGDAGALFIFSASRNLVEAVAVWGEAPPPEQVFAPDDCYALRRGQAQVGGEGAGAPPCAHVPRGTGAYLCVPLMSHGEAMGLLHILPASPDEDRLKGKQRLAQTVAGQLGLALANLKMQESLREMAVRDPLTGLFNRRYLEETLEREFLRAARQAAPIALIMLDIDHFKRCNDTYGHDAGDVLLRELGAFLQRYCRGSDVACRYGGEEFILTLSDCSLETACQRAEEMRQAVKTLQVHHGHRTLEAITLSFGVAAFPEHGDNPDAVLNAADAAMYRAKQQGRDRVVAAGGDRV